MCLQAQIDRFSFLCVSNHVLMYKFSYNVPPTLWICSKHNKQTQNGAKTRYLDDSSCECAPLDSGM